MEILTKNRIFHIYNRGNHKEKICFDIEDYNVLKKLLLYYFNYRFFDIISFCIMPNHFHLLIARTGNPKIEKAMQLIDGRYTKYINRKYGLVGHLFQGRYKKKEVISIRYFSTLLRYIKNNPAEIKGLYTYFAEENETLIKHYKMKLLQDSLI